MKRIALGMVLALSLMVSAAYAEAPSNNINFFIGQKTLDSDDWALGYDEQGEIGLLCDFRGQDWPVSLAIELLGSAKEETFNGVHRHQKNMGTRGNPDPSFRGRRSCRCLRRG